MLKNKEPNPLSVFGLRRVDHCPPHFAPVRFDLRVSEKSISDWIWENLEGRFYFGDQYYFDSQDRIAFEKVAAFESPAESSYFLLMLDIINSR